MPVPVTNRRHIATSATTFGGPTVLSTISGPVRPDGSHFSGYTAVVNFRHIGLFATRELAQRAVEATLAD